MTNFIDQAQNEAMSAAPSVFTRIAYSTLKELKRDQAAEILKNWPDMVGRDLLAPLIKRLFGDQAEGSISNSETANELTLALEANPTATAYLYGAATSRLTHDILSVDDEEDYVINMYQAVFDRAYDLITARGAPVAIPDFMGIKNTLAIIECSPTFTDSGDKFFRAPELPYGEVRKRLVTHVRNKVQLARTNNTNSKRNATDECFIINVGIKDFGIYIQKEILEEDGYIFSELEYTEENWIVAGSIYEQIDLIELRVEDLIQSIHEAIRVQSAKVAIFADNNVSKIRE